MFTLIFGIVLLLLAFAASWFLKRQKATYPMRLAPWGIGVFAIATLLNGATFYAEPGYNYHIRTIAGTESIATTTGWKLKMFGRVEPWKKAITVATTNDSSIDQESVSVMRGCLDVRMLDKVNGCLSTSVRFRMPDDTESMLKLAREYRTQNNLLNAALVPTVNRVMLATAQLMGAEEFYNGGRSTFDIDFDQQMREGVYRIRRIEREKPVTSSNQRKAQANASIAIFGEAQQVFNEEEGQLVFTVEKVVDPKTGSPIVLEHNFLKFGVVVEDAIVTGFDPNKEFLTRLSAIQEASAARAQARERRLQEEEQKLLAVVQGERQQAEVQAEALKEQMKLTTEAETTKQLALTEAQKLKEQAEIQKEAAAIALERDRLIAQSQKVLADADAYAREAVIRADDALDKKLQAEIQIQQYWADAFAKRAVPHTVFSTGSGGNTPVGSNTELNQILQLMTVQMADRLDYNRNVDTGGNQK